MARNYSPGPKLFARPEVIHPFTHPEVIRPIQCINALSNTVNISQFFAYIQPLHLVSQILYLWHMNMSLAILFIIGITNNYLSKDQTNSNNISIKEHIVCDMLAPSAVASATFSIRASTHPAGGFCRIGKQFPIRQKRPPE